MKKKGKLLEGIFSVPLVALFFFFVLSACGENNILEEGIEKEEATKNTEEVERNEFLQEREEIVQEEMLLQEIKEEKKKTPILYRVPLNEIAERIRYLEQIARLWDTWRWEYWELGALPKEGVMNVSLYTLEGNKIVFLPEGRENIEVQVGNRICKLYESEELGGYLFYIICDWRVEEMGIPLNSLESSIIEYCIVKSEKGQEEETKEYGRNYNGKYSLKDLTWIGEVEVDMRRDETFHLPSIETEENGYIFEVLNYIVKRAKEEELYGSFDIYLDVMKRGRGIYKGEGTGCWINFAIVGDEIREYKTYFLSDDGDIRLRFTMEDILFRRPKIRGNEEEMVSRTIRNARGVIHLEVEQNTEIFSKESLSYGEGGNSRDYSNLGLKEALDLIEYAWSYGEWFGMNEIGYKYGKLKSLEGKDIDVFLDESQKDRLYFCIVNEQEGGSYYELRGSQNRSQEGQLETGLITIYETGTNIRDKKLGRGKIEGRELTQLKVKNIEEDEYVLAMEEYIREMLLKNGKKGEYEICYGEYEALRGDKVCLSAAVTGEEEYYVRCLIVKYGEGKYHFWPVGFGLNGSLEECEAERHYMNKVCIERTKKLERHSRIMTIAE